MDATGPALQAFQQAQQVADADPNDEVEVSADLLAGLALACQRTGHPDQAIAHFRTLVAKDPAWADAKTIADQHWFSTEKDPLEEIRSACTTGAGSVAGAGR
jgi:tetratricopeptide (TPR) repeat protein